MFQTEFQMDTEITLHKTPTQQRTDRRPENQEPLPDHVQIEATDEAVISPGPVNGEPPPDPSRLRSIPDFDIYLFNMGEHRRAYQFLGAHLVDGGVRFAVWAPNAQQVSLVGSFNNWNIHAHAMERRGSTGVWERFVPGLQHGFYYKFAVQKPGGRW
jgi:hypothetical protein